MALLGWPALMAEQLIWLRPSDVVDVSVPFLCMCSMDMPLDTANIKFWSETPSQDQAWPALMAEHLVWLRPSDLVGVLVPLDTDNKFFTWRNKHARIRQIKCHAGIELE